VPDASSLITGARKMADKKVAYSPSSPDFLGPIFKYWTTSSGQYGLVNIRYGESSNAQTEQDIVENVAGYGKQIGKLLEAVVFLAHHLGEKDKKILADKTITALMELNTDIQLRKLNTIKQDSLSLTQFIDDLSELKDKDQTTFKEVSARLTATLADLN
jgi:hypothetical protein